MRCDQWFYCVSIAASAEEGWRGIAVAQTDLSEMLGLCSQTKEINLFLAFIY